MTPDGKPALDAAHRAENLPSGEAAKPSEVERLNVDLREANEHLVVATVQARIAVEQADDANRLKDDFIATVSHEIRTPLNAVLGWARMLKAKQLTAEREHHAIDAIERNAVALAHMVNDLLDASRITAGTLQISCCPTDLIAVTRTAIDVAKPLASEKQIEIGFVVEPASPAVISGDAERLQQVVVNLLMNAIKFTSRSGRVDVSLARVGSTFELSVADTGVGISSDFLPHVFERFRQADGAPSRRHGGLGLGLTIVRELVELHGGMVRAASAGAGYGATFTVCLPSLGEIAPAAREPGTPPPAPAAPALSPRLDHLHVLVVDDDDDGRALTTLVLTQSGASVTAVATAQQALRLLGGQRPDVVVSDIRLPDQDGYSLVRQVRLWEREHGCAVPAIALTGYARAEDRQRALTAGFDAHVAKPMHPAELLETVVKVTERSRI